MTRFERKLERDHQRHSRSSCLGLVEVCHLRSSDVFGDAGRVREIPSIN